MVWLQGDSSIESPLPVRRKGEIKVTQIDNNKEQQ
jgi:hypothetical protein